MRVFLDFYLYFCHAVQSSAMPVVATRRLVKIWQGKSTRATNNCLGAYKQQTYSVAETRNTISLCNTRLYQNISLPFKMLTTILIS